MPVRVEGAIRLLGAIVLALMTGLITYLVFDFAVGGQLAALAAGVVFVATTAALSWAFR